MNLRSVNLNLFPLLQALLREESVGRAAASVGLSQPAMSEALTKLRALLSDPLLVRVGRTMELTPRAQQLQEEVDFICTRLGAVLRPASFDPKTAREIFTIAAPDYLAQAVTPLFLRRITDVAPGIKIRFVDISGRLPGLVRQGDIDLAVCGDFEIWPELASQYLFTDRVVCVVSKHHQLAHSRRISIDEARKLVSIGYTRDPQDLDQLDTGVPGLDFETQVSTNRFFDAVLIASQSDLAAQVPASLVASVKGLVDVSALELDDSRTHFRTSLFWSRAKTHALEHQWLRAFTIDCFQAALPHLVSVA